MLSLQEKMYAIELLAALGLEDLLTIAKTTTNRILNPTTKEEAIEVITSYEEDPRSLLNRKKVTKVLLFNYLHWKKVSFPANADKSQLIEVVLQLWNTCTTQFGRRGSNPAITQGPYESPPSAEKPSAPPYQIQSETQGNALVVANQAPGTVHQPPPPNTQVTKTDNSTAWVDVMSVKFSEWFYSMLNENSSQPNGSTLKEEDFWKDSSARVKILSGGNVTTYDAKNSEEVVTVIKGVKNEHNLMFNPNLSSHGVKGKLDPHGIVMVIACGTLHQGVGECVGVFEQIFSLIKDPLSSDNWKVKRTELSLRTQSRIAGPPCLEEGEFIGQLVELTKPD